MIKRKIFLLVLFIFNTTNSIYINGGCCNSCKGKGKGKGTSKGEINNNNQSKQKNKNNIPNGNPLSKIIPGNIIQITDNKYPGNPTNPNNAQQNNPNNNIQEPKNETVTPGLKGLQNVGATCYMNATLQCFSNCRGFRTELTEICKKLEKGKDGKHKLTFALAEVLENLWSNNGEKCYSPNNFKDTIGKINALYEDNTAKDPSTLVMILLQTIHKELNKTNHNISFNEGNNQDKIWMEYNNFMNKFRKQNNSIIINEFYYYQNRMETCGNCFNTSPKVQSNNILDFPLEEVRKFKGYIDNLVSIKDCFEYNQREQTFNDYYCSKCNQVTTFRYKTQIISAPKTLVINLNRGKGIEYDVKIKLEETMDIREFVFMNNSPYYYELTGVICHFGENNNAGHFIAYCKNSNNCKWYKFNDAFVEECPFTEVQEKGLPYVLFYNYVDVGE